MPWLCWVSFFQWWLYRWLSRPCQRSGHSSSLWQLFIFCTTNLTTEALNCGKTTIIFTLKKKTKILASSPIEPLGIQQGEGVATVPRALTTDICALWDNSLKGCGLGILELRGNTSLLSGLVFPRTDSCLGGWIRRKAAAGQPGARPEALLRHPRGHIWGHLHPGHYNE